MTNQERSQIVQQAKANGYQGSYVDLFKQAAANPNEKLFAASSPMQKAEGLRPHHEAGMTDSSMVFEDMGPNTSFNTMGLKAPINIDKYDDKGHLVKSYDSVPPGIQDLDMGPNRGTVVETPASMQEGGFNSDYNYKRAKELGYKPDEDGHWPSVDYKTGDLLKSKKHPTVKKEFISQMHSPDRKMIADPTGHFGDDHLKYVPRKKQQEGGENPGEYMNKMEPRVFPNQKRDAKWVKYAEDHDFAGRFPGETRTNKEIGLQRSNRNTVPLPTTSVRPKELKKMQGGFFNIDSKGQDILSGRRPKRRKRAQSGAGVETQPGRIAEGLPTFEDLGGWDGVMENAPDFLLSPFATVRERLAENIKPLGYGEDPAQRVLDAVWNNKPEKYSEGWTEEEGKRDDRDDYMRERTDFLAMTMGQDQPYSTVKKSEYAPSKGSWFDKITGKDYYVSPTTEKWIQGKLKRGGADKLIAEIEKNRDPETNVSSKYWSSGGKDNTLGNYTLDVGEDEKGRYISYHDQWDLNPFSGTMLGDNTFVKMGENALQSLLGVDPPEIYGRIYIDDKKSKKSRKGGFRPSGRRRSGI